jgi:enoyl-CoA hydratase
MAGTKVGLTVEAGTAWITLDGPERRNALAADLHRTVHDPSAWDRAVEIERARQVWSLAHNPKES